MEASAGKLSMARALFNGFGEMLLRPHHFLVQPSLWMVAGVYGCTYAAANLIDSGCERLLDRDDEKTPAVHGAVKLAGTTGVNMSAGGAGGAGEKSMGGGGKSHRDDGNRFGNVAMPILDRCVREALRLNPPAPALAPVG